MVLLEEEIWALKGERPLEPRWDPGFTSSSMELGRACHALPTLWPLTQRLWGAPRDGPWGGLCAPLVCAGASE